MVSVVEKLINEIQQHNIPASEVSDSIWDLYDQFSDAELDKTLSPLQQADK